MGRAGQRGIDETVGRELYGGRSNVMRCLGSQRVDRAGGARKELDEVRAVGSHDLGRIGQRAAATNSDHHREDRGSDRVVGAIFEVDAERAVARDDVRENRIAVGERTRDNYAGIKLSLMMFPSLGCTPVSSEPPMWLPDASWMNTPLPRLPRFAPTLPLISVPILFAKMLFPVVPTPSRLTPLPEFPEMTLPAPGAPIALSAASDWMRTPGPPLSRRRVPLLWVPIRLLRT